MRSPVRFSWTMVERVLNCSWISSYFLWMTRPKKRTMGGREIMGMRATAVRRGLIQSMRAREKTKLTVVFTAYMTAGPAAIRTARVSLVARLMRSPVRVRPKKAASRERRWAKKASRRSASTRRLVLFRICRMPNFAAPPRTAATTMRRAKAPMRRAVTPGSPRPSMANFMRYGPAVVKKLLMTTMARPAPMAFQ